MSAIEGWSAAAIAQRRFNGTNLRASHDGRWLAALIAITLLLLLNYASYRTLRIAERLGYSLHQEMVRLLDAARSSESGERAQCVFH